MLDRFLSVVVCRPVRSISTRDCPNMSSKRPWWLWLVVVSSLWHKTDAFGCSAWRRAPSISRRSDDKLLLPIHTTRTTVRSRVMTVLYNGEEKDIWENARTRRRLFQQAGSSLATVFVATNSPPLAVAASRKIPGSSAEHPVAVVGAGGRVGLEVIQELAKEGLYAVTMTRDGKEPPIRLSAEERSYVFHYLDPVDVRNEEDFKNALIRTQPSAIVYCASASSQGGTAREVDAEGVGYAAEAARELGALLVDISVLAVERPNSRAYQVTNSFKGNLSGMMDAKVAGEDRVRDILKYKKNYVIIRPGTFMNGTTKNGPIDIEINQGDTIGGGITVDEVAGVVVGALQSGKEGVTVEVLRRSTAMPLQPSFDQSSGKERFSDTYAGLFSAITPDD